MLELPRVTRARGSSARAYLALINPLDEYSGYNLLRPATQGHFGSQSKRKLVPQWCRQQCPFPQQTQDCQHNFSRFLDLRYPHMEDPRKLEAKGRDWFKSTFDPDWSLRSVYLAVIASESPSEVTLAQVLYGRYADIEGFCWDCLYVQVLLHSKLAAVNTQNPPKRKKGNQNSYLSFSVSSNPPVLLQ